jgi:hypothetical protein
MTVSACETPEERVSRLMPAAESRCGTYGFAKGTEAYAQCLQLEVQKMEDRENAEAAAIAAAIDASAPVTCYSSGYGYSTSTTCY